MRFRLILETLTPVAHFDTRTGVDNPTNVRLFMTQPTVRNGRLAYAPHISENALRSVLQADAAPGIAPPARVLNAVAGDAGDRHLAAEQLAARLADDGAGNDSAVGPRDRDLDGCTHHGHFHYGNGGKGIVAIPRRRRAETGGARALSIHIWPTTDVEPPPVIENVLLVIGGAPPAQIA